MRIFNHNFHGPGVDWVGGGLVGAGVGGTTVVGVGAGVFDGAGGGVFVGGGGGCVFVGRGLPPLLWVGVAVK